MKLFGHPKCLTEAIAPVIILNRLMGLRVFEFPRGRPRPILSLIYLLFLYCLYYIGSLYLTERYYKIVKLLKLEYFLYKVLNYIVIFLILIKLLLGWWYTKRFDACYKRIFKIDETLRQLGLTVNYDRIYFMTIGVLITWFTVNFSTCIVVFIIMQGHKNVYKTIGAMVAYSYALAVNAIIIFEFYIFVKCIQMRFDLINRLLHQYSTTLSANVMKLDSVEMQDYTKLVDVEQRRLFSMKMLSKWCRQKQPQGELRNRFQKHNSVMTECHKRKYLLQIIRQVHLELCKISKTICIILGIQIACEIGVIVMILTRALYNLYIRYIMQHKITESILQQTVVTIILSIFYTLKIAFLSRICKHAADKGNKTIEIIYSICGYDEESSVQEEIQQFGIQILQSPVRFSAYGISLDNYVWITMILKTITTYLVIMIQVSNLLESNKAIQNA